MCKGEMQFAANPCGGRTRGIDRALVPRFHRRNEHQGVVHVVSSTHSDTCGPDRLFQQAQDVCRTGGLPLHTIDTPASGAEVRGVIDY